MTAERRDLNGHERKERQTGKDVVQLLRAGHVEYADIRVPTGHSPQVTPDTGALQFLRASTTCFSASVLSAGKSCGIRTSISS